MSWLEFIERNIRLAHRLDKGDCDGSYTEGILILGCLLSGIASDLWPGSISGLDRKRFVELWHRFADQDLQPERISIPLLWEWLKRRGRSEEIIALRIAWSNDSDPEYVTHVLRGSEIDAKEGYVRSLCPSLSDREIREWSYPNVFYRHVRSMNVHEYHLEGAATEYPHSSGGSAISYANVIEDLNGPIRRKIFFDVAWVGDVTRSVAGQVEEQHSGESILRPNSWWVSP